ncbi:MULTISPECIES: hypothetical protein [unclassified Campylobacter]|uniref:hypothetical protein n=1 Tax=unclassified Campylobacter TaxID=2593542 RepID=UPI001BDADAFB|nr:MULTISPECIES: hypothetical protein [unclassified Campylobacter]MBT0880151.1 hypothetical protein [Campylobacter sp. 2018MI27]MBT0884784.1 hypothetical protein [Campylobacter sp. 2018MI10]
MDIKDIAGVFSSGAVLVAIYQLMSVKKNVLLQTFKSELDIFDRIKEILSRSSKLDDSYNYFIAKKEKTDEDSKEYYEIQAEIKRLDEEIENTDIELLNLLELYCYNINNKRLEADFAVKSYKSLFESFNMERDKISKYSELNKFLDNHIACAKKCKYSSFLTTDNIFLVIATIVFAFLIYFLFANNENKAIINLILN